MKIAIRVDASIKIGTGHVIRCLTLAEALKSKTVEILFICREHQANLITFLHRKGFQITALPLEKQEDYSSTPHAEWLGANWDADSRRTIDILQKTDKVFDWLIVDHNALDYRWEQSIRPYVNQIMVIDGLADRKHDCDFLLDQNYFSEDRFQELIPQHCEKLLGPQYSLLKKTFLEERKKANIRDGNIRRILLFFSGIDMTNETGKALDAILLLNRAYLEVDIVLGVNNPHKKEIQDKVSSLPRVTCHVQIDYMAELMRKADLAIGAVGAVTWERCCLGLPTMAITLAPNQEPAAFELAQEGFLYYLGKNNEVDSSALARHLQCLLENPNLVHHLSERAFSLVDGQGTQRVLQKIFHLDIIS